MSTEPLQQVLAYFWQRNCVNISKELLEMAEVNYLSYLEYVPVAELSCLKYLNNILHLIAQSNWGELSVTSFETAYREYQYLRGCKSAQEKVTVTRTDSLLQLLACVYQRRYSAITKEMTQMAYNNYQRLLINVPREEQSRFIYLNNLFVFCFQEKWYILASHIDGAYQEFGQLRDYIKVDGISNTFGGCEPPRQTDGYGGSEPTYGGMVLLQPQIVNQGSTTGSGSIQNDNGCSMVQKHPPYNPQSFQSSQGPEGEIPKSGIQQPQNNQSNQSAILEPSKVNQGQTTGGGSIKNDIRNSMPQEHPPHTPQPSQSSQEPQSGRPESDNQTPLPQAQHHQQNAQSNHGGVAISGNSFEHGDTHELHKQQGKHTNPNHISTTKAGNTFRNDDITLREQQRRNEFARKSSQKMRYNNPNIADLSDANRPTKTAERFSELYDNLWTEAYEELTNAGESEPQTIELLLKIVQRAYSYCREESEKQMKAIELAFHGILTGGGIKENSEDNTTSSTGLLVQYRKEIAEHALERLQKEFLRNPSHLIHICAQNGLPKNLEENGQIVAYANKCVELAWWMCVQDPPIRMHMSDSSEREFKPSMYKAYTKTGKTVDFYVWPALWLHDGGSVLMKGVAQCQ